jgi:hypothetical protein
MNKDTKLSLLMSSLTDFYRDKEYIDEIKSIVDQTNIISLRILDWFITNYSKKFRTLINQKNGNKMDVYMNYKLMLKSYNKSAFDPFCRKNKIFFYYTDEKFIETSCGQLCFFRWCFENDILAFVKNNLKIIEQDMKSSLKQKKDEPMSPNTKKRQPLSIPAGRSISKTNTKYVLQFD